MTRKMTAAAIALLLPALTAAAQPMTSAQIEQVIAATDAASMNRDAGTLAGYLSERFEKRIDVPSEEWLASVKIGKQDYLEMINRGWDRVEDYRYQRDDTVIHIAPDGLSGESASTITEVSTVGGKTMTSKVREYARYEFEEGRPVITRIQGHTLVGDTTPGSGQ